MREKEEEEEEEEVEESPEMHEAAAAAAARQSKVFSPLCEKKKRGNHQAGLDISP